MISQMKRPAVLHRSPGGQDAGAHDPHGDGARCSLVVDARGLRLSGIGRFLREVLRHLLRDPRFGRVVLLGRPDELAEFTAAHDPRGIAEVVPFAFHFYSAGAQLRWAALQASGALRADVAFFPHYDVPLTDVSGRNVVVVQDLSHFKLPELFAAWKRALAGVVLRRAVRRAARVVVTSEWTRGDLLAAGPGAADRLSVVPLGVDAAAGPAGAERGRGDRGAEALRPFLLCVGNRKPNKNLVAAVETLARARAWAPALRLVIVGEDFGEDGEVRERARALGVDDAVTWFGRASDAELGELYAAAECLLFPSLYEGFGLPPLEAMAAGVPVVASNRASIPEVVGDAAQVVDPFDWDAMADAVRRLMEDPAYRADQVERGRRRARQFPWTRTAAQVVELLLEAAVAVPAEAPAPRRPRRAGRPLTTG